MSKDQWLAIFDLIVSFPEYPELFHIIAISEVIAQRKMVLSLKDQASLIQYFKNFGVGLIEETIKTSFKILSKLQRESISTSLQTSQTIPLQKECYQPFKFIPSGSF